MKKNRLLILGAILLATFSIAAKVQVPQLSTGTSLDTGDKMYFIDFSDKTDGATGTGKAINWEDFTNLMPVDVPTTFNAKKYGAKGNGITLFDGAVSASSTAFSSASATFTSADVGKVITITGAGGTNVDHTTTIAAFVDATHVTLTAAAVATVSGAIYTYGTDDTTAINTIITTIAAQSNPQGTIYFPSGTYIINGAFNKANNSQIGMPTISSTDTTPKNHTIIKFQGSLYGKSTNTQRFATGGSILYSTKNGTAGTSVISGKAVGSSGSLTDVRIELDTITVRTVQDPVNSALDLEFINSMILNNVYVEAGTVLLDNRVQPTTSTSYGIKTVGVLNNSISYLKNVRVQGFYNGIAAQEHAQLDNIFILHAVNGLVITSTGHAVYGEYIGIERTINNIVCSAPAGSFIINVYDTEHSSGFWYDTLFDIKDASSNCLGNVNYFIQDTGGGSALLVSGAKKINTFDLKGTSRLWKQSTTGVNIFENTGTADGTSSGATVSVGQNSGAATTIGARLGTFSFIGVYDANASHIFGAQIGARAEQNFVSSSTGGTYMYFATTANGAASPTERLRITNSGNVGIATTAPSALLTVGPTPSVQFIVGTSGSITSAGNVGINTTAPTTCGCKQYTNGLCTTVGTCS